MNEGKKVAFLFPGQGSQKTGMGRDLFDGSRAARDVFEEVDEALGRRLTRMIFEGPEDALRRTENAQPAIFAVSMAAYAAAKEAGVPVPDPTKFAGHSLGEFSAIAAAGALSIHDTAILVQERGHLMRLACEERPGGMVALIGLDEFAAGDVCRETGTEMANINGSQQIVISGNQENLAQAIDLAAARGAKKCILLKVAGAFHSSHMEPAQAGLAKAIESVTWHKPRVPIIANCDGRPLTGVPSIKKELRAQIVSCVQWNRSVEFMDAEGIKTFVEIGPGKVLTGLIGRIRPKATVLNVDSMESIEALRVA